MKSVKVKLVQISDEKMRQKICLTSIDKDSKLFKKKSWLWNKIKSGKFMIINGQQSITTLKELQILDIADKRCLELAKWEAYIVWSLDQVKLTNILKFYNSTGHLEHV